MVCKISPMSFLVVLCCRNSWYIVECKTKTILFQMLLNSFVLLGSKCIVAVFCACLKAFV